MSGPRIGFAGTPEFAAIILRALLDHDADVTVVYTQPDRPSGRGRKLQPSAVKRVAIDHQLEVRQPATLRDERVSVDLAACALDVLIVAAYGLILPEQILAIPRRGCINVHASLLPRWRGAAPVERAIMAGDEQTGVSIMQMDTGLDTGPVLATASCPISDDTLGADLELTLAELGARCLLDCLSELETLTPQPQKDAGATYAHKLTPQDARVDWHQAGRNIERQVRALCTRMPATAIVGDLRIKLLDAQSLAESFDATPGTVVSIDREGIQIACGEGSLVLRRLQLNRGKGRPLAAADAGNGYPEIFAVGATLAERT
jgi:methionyl-tRNA formyltransferase